MSGTPGTCGPELRPIFSGMVLARIMAEHGHERGQGGSGVRSRQVPGRDAKGTVLSAVGRLPQEYEEKADAPEAPEGSQRTIEKAPRDTPPRQHFYRIGLQGDVSERTFGIGRPECCLGNLASAMAMLSKLAVSSGLPT